MPRVAISPAGQNSSSQSVGVASSGDAIAVWTTPGPLSVVQTVKYHASTSTWDAAPIDQSNITLPASEARISVDSAGDAILV